MIKILLVFLLGLQVTYAQKQTRWVEIGKGTYNQDYIYPYKIKLSVPYGVRDIDDIKEGLLPMKFDLLWLRVDSTKQDVEKIFKKQLKDHFANESNYQLSKNIINFFLNKLPATVKHQQWEFIYYPDEGTKLFIDDKQIYHLIGAELNRALIQSWINTDPVLTSYLFKRLLKLQK